MKIPSETLQENPFQSQSIETPLQEINDPLLYNYGIRLLVKRDDLIHPFISGNKWYKLKYNIEYAIEKDFRTVLTFGGAYSNHIYATAAAGKICGLNTIGIIRGEEHLPLNPTLQFAKKCGMKLHYLNRSSYREKHKPPMIKSLHKKFGSFYCIPEGGTNMLAVKGSMEIIKSIKNDFDYICCACGTGGTIAGIIAGLKNKKYVIGFSVLKGADFLTENVKRLLSDHSPVTYANWEINTDYHFGGYAKFNAELIKFIRRFKSITNIPVEPVYTGKLFFGIYDKIKKGYFKRGSTVIALHSGGMQGLDGMKIRYPDLKL